MSMEAAIVSCLPDPLALKPKMTLPEILGLMQAADEGMRNLSMDEMELLAGKLEDKVDAYKTYIEGCEKEAERLSARIKDFQAARRGIENRGDNLKKLLAFHMKAQGFPFLRGRDYKAVLGSSKSVHVKAEALPALFLQWGHYMRISYEWDKPKIAAAIKAGNPLVNEIAETEESFNCKFVVNKGAIDD